MTPCTRSSRRSTLLAEQLHAWAGWIASLRASDEQLRTRLSEATHELDAMTVARGDPRYPALAQDLAAITQLTEQNGLSQLARIQQQLIGGLERLADLPAELSQLTASLDQLRAGADRLATGTQESEEGAVKLDSALHSLAADGHTLSGGLTGLSGGAGQLATGLGRLTTATPSSPGRARQAHERQRTARGRTRQTRQRQCPARRRTRQAQQRQPAARRRDRPARDRQRAAGGRTLRR